MFEGLGNAVHLIAAVVWIGGLALLVLGLRPALKKGIPEEAAHAAVETPLHRRFFVISALCAAVLLLSGFMLMTSDPHYTGAILSPDNLWEWMLAAKHALFVGMLGLLFAQRKSREAKIERDLIDIALMLGVAILVVTGILTSLP